MNTVNSLLKQAITETHNLVQGEVFLVKDLFKGYEWNRIVRKDRLLLGTLFLKHINDGQSNNIEAVDKTSSNQQRYRVK